MTYKMIVRVFILVGSIGAAISGLSSLNLSADFPPLEPVQTVDTLVDEIDLSCTDGDCSIRDALNGVAPGGEINFAVSGTIYIASELRVNGPITINGGNQIVLDGSGSNHLMRFENFLPGSETIIDGITLQNAYSDQEGGPLQSAGGKDWTLVIKNSHFISNTAEWDGGAIYVTNNANVIVENSTFIGNRAQRGSAIYNNSGTIEVTNSLIQNNISTGYGAAIESLNSNQGVTTTLVNSVVHGNIPSGLLLYGESYNGWPATLQITNSTVSQSGSSGIVNFDGQIYVVDSLITENAFRGITNFEGQMFIENSTISGNSTDSVTLGGGIFNSNGGVLHLNQSTVTENYASEGGAGVLNYNGPLPADSMIITGSIVSGNDTSDGAADLELYNLDFTANTFSSGGYNLIGSIAGGVDSFDEPGDQVSVTNPALGPLQNNGGPTWTHLPQAGSPAIDAGNNSNCPAFDQRGAPRPHDGDDNISAVCDIGAVEAGSQVPAVSTPVVTPISTPEATPDVSVTRVPNYLPMIENE